MKKYSLIFTDSYNKKAKKFLKKNPTILGQYQKILQLLVLNPYHPSLRLHKLSGKLNYLYSVSINMCYRITLDFIIEDNTIIPINIGHHDVVYQ